MENGKKYFSPQLALTTSGIILIMLAGMTYAPVGSGLPDTEPSQNSANQLKVGPSRGAPASAINQIQGAGGLQNQGTQGLQHSVGEQLQPNAKTDDFNSVRTVQ